VYGNFLIYCDLKIGGAGSIDEFNKSFFVRRKKCRSNTVTVMDIFGGICHESNECFVVCVPDRSENTLLPIICECIRVGSTILF